MASKTVQSNVIEMPKAAAKTATQAPAKPALKLTITNPLDEFAFKLGGSYRLELPASEKLFNTYSGLDDDGKAAYKTRFYCRYLMGALQVSADQAESVLKMTRTQREALPNGTAYQNAVRAADGKWNWHFINRGPAPAVGRGNGKGFNMQATLESLPAGATKALTTACNQHFNGDWEQMFNAVKALRMKAEQTARKAAAKAA